MCLIKPRYIKTYGGEEAQLHTFLTLTLDGEWSASYTGRFTPTKRAPGTHCVGGWVGSKASLDVMEKSLFPKVGTESLFFDRRECSLVAIPMELLRRNKSKQHDNDIYINIVNRSVIMELSSHLNEILHTHKHATMFM
jgi:hypothetical protein